MSEGTNEPNNKAHFDGQRGGMALEHALWDEMLAAYVADELGAVEHLDFDRHLAACAVCRSALADTRHIRMLLRSLAAPATHTDAALSLASRVLSNLPYVARDDGKDESGARPVSSSDSVLYPESLQWRSAAAQRRSHPALTWHSRDHGRERWRMGMENDTRNASEGNPHDMTTTPTLLDDDPPSQDTPALPPLGRQPVSFAGRLAATVAAVLLVAVLGSILFANRPRGTGSTAAANAAVASTSTASGASNLYAGGLTSISMVSATEGWAVGPMQLGDPKSTGNILLHYANGMWTRAVVPTQASLYGVAMVSTTEGWAVGSGGVILHYSAGRWSEVKSPTITNLYSISMVSAQEGWAVGANEFGGNAVILHFADGAWTNESLPTPSSADMSLYAVAMVSAREGWAVGEDRESGGGGLILRYDGTGWTLDARVPGALLHGVSVVSPTDAWAVGSDGGAPLLLRYTGTKWQRVAAPSDAGDGTLSSVSMVSANEGWAVGSANGGNIYDINGTFTVTNVILLHYSHGAWTSVIPPNVPGAETTSVSMVSANEGWAVGQVIVRHGSQGVEITPLLFHYLDGTWSVAK